MEEKTVEIIIGEGVLYQIETFWNIASSKPITKKLLIKFFDEENKTR